MFTAKSAAPFRSFTSTGICRVPTAKLVVVIENPPPADKKWILDYVVRDRRLLMAWDGDRKTLKFPPEVGTDLQFLA